jgi:hypothetical protein
MQKLPISAFASIRLLALSLQLGGCASEELLDEAQPSSTSSALSASRTIEQPTSASDANATLAARKGTTSLATLSPLQPATPPAPPGPNDLQSSYPWVVDIGDTGNLGCRGVLIHPSWVLTAGHCIGSIAGTVSYSRTDPVTGVVSSDSRPFNASGPSRGMFVHPDFDLDTGFGQPVNDVALIRLATPFTLSRHIQTVALPRSPANPGRTGTIATHNHFGPLPAGSTAVLRAPQLGPNDCAMPTGFVCIEPPASSLCKGDSGGGFVMTLDGRAQVVGVVSNISGGDTCIPAGGEAQLADVFHYRGWILATMGMSLEQVAGRVRLRRAGASNSGIMSLQCLAPESPAIDVPMNVPGGEIGMDCDDVRVFCQPQGTGLSLSGFSVRTIAPNGSSTVSSLPFLAGWTAAFADPGASFLEHTCSVSRFGTVLTTGTTGTAVLAL